MTLAGLVVAILLACGSLALPGCESRSARMYSISGPPAAYHHPGHGDPVLDATYRLHDPHARAENEQYERVLERRFVQPTHEPLSTFSIDVDTASYSNVRRFLEDGQLPPRDAVRIEEMVNYFAYDYRTPSYHDDPLATDIEVAECPWEPASRLVRVGLSAREIEMDDRQPVNLVFLIDVSGSMRSNDKLPLLKKSMRALVHELDRDDRVGIVTYANRAEVVLHSTSCHDRERILNAIDRLAAGGSTNGEDGLHLAYHEARAHLDPHGVNRVILASDGDFNVGRTDPDTLVDNIERHAADRIFLTILGFGTGNYKDARLEKLADHGDGNYAYIDSYNEGRRVLVEQMGATLITVAKDVKIQVEFNPAMVEAYRLLGYENRMLAARDFNDDEKDAGEVGSGHQVTALYEIVPRGGRVPHGEVDPLKYQHTDTVHSYDPRDRDELLTLKIRYQEPEGGRSRLIETAVHDSGRYFEEASEDFRFAAAVAEFGLLLRGSRYRGRASMDQVIEIARCARGEDRFGYRAEMIQLARSAENLMRSARSNHDDHTFSSHH